MANAPLTGSAATCLAACQNANDMALAYHPAHAFAGQATRLVRAGYMVRNTGGLSGGFWITDAGRSANASAKAARLLSSRRRG